MPEGVGFEIGAKQKKYLVLQVRKQSFKGFNVSLYSKHEYFNIMVLNEKI